MRVLGDATGQLILQLALSARPGWPVFGEIPLDRSGGGFAFLIPTT